MTSFKIADADLENIKDQVVIVTGASSGIGLATVKRLLHHGAKVYASDLNPLPSPEDTSVPYQKVDVASWEDQLEMFKAAEQHYGKIDHVFANAGITTTCNLLEDDVDENGDPLPPKLNTLAIHYLRKNEKSGSIVVTASASSFSRFSHTDYTTAKHGVLGLMRALSVNLHPKLRIRINAIAPSWTATNIIPPAFTTGFGENVQTADVAARSAIVLMADEKRHGECVYSEKGSFWEMENGEKGVHALLKDLMEGADVEGSLAVADDVSRMLQEAAAAGTEQ